MTDLPSSLGIEVLDVRWARVERLERELDAARAESDQLRDEIADRDRRLLAADQHVHAERAVRVEVEQTLSRQSRVARRDLGKLRERVADLERELMRMRRAVDEAQHLVAAAEAARSVAQRPAVGRGGERDARVAPLERELAAAREAVDAERRRSARAYEAIELVRGELRQLWAGTAAQPSPAAAATAPPPIGRAEPAAPVQAERLNAALARLREQPRAEPIGEAQLTTPVESPPAAGAVRPWLGKAFRALVAEDASAAGRLLLALLPAQSVADPRPVVYDLVLSDVVVAHVTVGSGGTGVELDTTARPLPQVDFRLTGDLAGTARFLVAGRVRRRLHLGRRLARIQGDRDRLAALETLIAAPLTLKQLSEAGVRPDPTLCLTLAALMIEPEWTAGELFTVSHQDPRGPSPGAHLHIRDARPPMVSEERSHAPVATVIACPADELLAVLAGEPVTDVSISGDQRPWSLIRQWVDRAQCG